MIHIHNLSDTAILIHDPELQRAITSYLLYCKYELLEYADEEDIDDFNFIVLSEEYLPMLTNLGSPEETVQISIQADGHIATIYRISYPTTGIFIPAEISDQISL